MSFSAASSLTFPPTEFSLRWYLSFFQDARWLAAMRTSLLVALLSSLLALLLGSVAAYGLARGTFRGRQLVDSNFMAPMIVPPFITAVALYLVFARFGLLSLLPGLLLGPTFLAVPPLFLSIGT